MNILFGVMNQYDPTVDLKVNVGNCNPRVMLVGCKSALNPPVVYSTDLSKAVVPVLVLLFVALWLILQGDLF